MEKQEKQRDEYCCVPLCNGNARIHNELSFHHIPSEKKTDLRKKWIIAIRRDEGALFKIGSNTVVCSRHFKKEDYRWTPNRKCLKSDAVPSVFEWRQEAQKRKEPTLRLPLVKKLREETNDEVAAETQNVEPAPLYIAEEIELDVHLQCNQRIETLEKVIKEKEAQISKQNEELCVIKQKYQLEKFGVTRFSFDNDMIEFYTGFPTYELFVQFYKALQPSALKMKSVYYNPSEDINTKGRPRCMEFIDELFMFLCRLKCGFLTEDLAVRFNVHVSTVSRKVITWANFLYFILGRINIWPSKGKIAAIMPPEFQQSYPRTRIIIDCTEIFTERPSSLALSSKTYSSYKSHNTWKGLVGIAPHGALIFVSCLYSGCMSDIEITKSSGLLQLLEPGDQIMADKGFILNKLLQDTGISIATPHFLCSDGQFTASQIEANQKIASLRIHVERHIKRVKEYKLLQTTVPLSIAGTVNQMWTIANFLTLFRRPLIKKGN